MPKNKERKEIPSAHQWDLAPLFPDDAAWEVLYREIEGDIPRYASFRGTLDTSAAALKDAVVFDLSLSRRIDRCYVYAHLKSDEDKTDQHYLGFMDRMMNLVQRAAEASSWMMPEIMAIPMDVMERYRADSVLAEYRFYLEKMLRNREYTLNESEERILALSREVGGAAHDVFSQLDNADMKYGTIKDATGAERELTHGNFITFLMNQDRSVRQRAFEQYYAQYHAHRHSLSAAHASSVKADHFYASVRRFPSARASALHPDNVDGAVYDNLVSAVKKNVSTVHRYYRLRARMLGVETLCPYDLYVPLVKDVKVRIAYEEAVATCGDALRPIGGDYVKTLTEGLLGGWVDRYENRGKRSGAYSSGCYDSPPYILLNYEDENIGSMYTLAHEAGHSMHSYYSRSTQPYVYGDYTIFVAEVASTVNEALLTDHLAKKYKNDKAMRMYIINREIEEIRTTLVRQTMFAEFEHRTHREREENRPLTLETMTAIYRTILEEYFGDTMNIGDLLPLEYLRIPHFYSAFYVYKYATGIAAALDIVKRIKSDPSAVQQYRQFLSLGGSAFPLDELRVAGVDLASGAPVANALSYLASLVDELEEAYEASK